jgi:hypothetical protein
MRINTNTELTIVECRAIEKARQIFIRLGKHGNDAMQDRAAKAVAAINLLEIELKSAEALPLSLQQA